MVPNRYDGLVISLPLIFHNKVFSKFNALLSCVKAVAVTSVNTKPKLTFFIFKYYYFLWNSKCNEGLFSLLKLNNLVMGKMHLTIPELFSKGRLRCNRFIPIHLVFKL